MAEFEIGTVRGTSIVKGLVKLSMGTPVDDDGTVSDSVGDVDIMYPCGVMGRPAPGAEVMIARNIEGTNVCLAGRDESAADMIGDLPEGSIAMYAPHPNRSAQIRCDGPKRQANLITRSDDEEQAFLSLDGANKKFQIMGWDMLFEMEKKKITLSSGGSARIVLDGDRAYVMAAQIVFGGQNPIMPLCAAPGPVAGVSGSTVPATGCFWGV